MRPQDPHQDTMPMLTPIRPTVVQAPFVQSGGETRVEPYIERDTQRRLPWETGSVIPAAPPAAPPTLGAPPAASPPPPAARPATTHTVWSGTSNGSGENRESGSD
jgi:hypothetical protein